MSVLDKATAHFAAQGGNTVEVPEWDATVHFACPTLVQRARWSKYGEAKAQARVLIECAKNEDGSPMFPDEPDTTTKILNTVDPSVTARIVKAILGADDAVEDMGNV